MATLSAQELADLVPRPLDEVRRLEALGLLERRDGDAPFEPSDVHAVRLMSAFEAAGISLEDVAQGVAAGELTFPLGRFMPEPVAVSETYECSPPRSAARRTCCAGSTASSG